MAKGKGRKKDQREHVEIIRERLPVQLSDAEVSAHADRAARLQSELDDAEGELKAYVKAEKASIDTLRSERNEALRRVREKRDHREVDVEVIRVFAENAVKFKRIDTGEVYRERAMTYAERQEQLFELPAPAPVAAPAASAEAVEPAQGTSGPLDDVPKAAKD